MPDARRRKRRERRARAGDTRGAASAPPRAGAGRQPTPAPMPSTTARATGFIIALITAILGGIVVVSAFRDQSGAGLALQAVGGVLLIALAIVVAALVLIPYRVRDFVRRLRR